MLGGETRGPDTGGACWSSYGPSELGHEIGEEMGEEMGVA